jgi:hypothetical protein
MGEAQEMERLRLPFPIPPSTFDGKSPELDQARHFRMQFQPELSQPFPPLLQELLRSFPALEPDDEVRVADDDHIAPRELLAPPDDPLVVYIVQVEVRQHP